MSENANKKIPPEIMPHCEKSNTNPYHHPNRRFCILRHFFIETMTTTLPYESRTSKMQQEQVIQSDCRNTNTNFNHDISPYHNSNPRYNIGISRCKGTGPFLSPYKFLQPPPPPINFCPPYPSTTN